MKISQAVSNRINDILKIRDMSIYQLEVITGISHSTMSCLMLNRYESVNLKTILLIIQSLNITILDFFDCIYFRDLDKIIINQ